MQQQCRFKNDAERLDAMLQGAISSQIPCNVTKKSYSRMQYHATDETGRWFCKTTGANIKGRMTMMKVYNRQTASLDHAEVPVIELYCERCDEFDKPKTAKGAAIMSDEIRTVSL